MTATRWWPGIQAADPAPGDADALAAIAGFLARVAQGAQGAFDQLRGSQAALDELVWTGTAADAFRTHQSLLLPRLRKVATSYARAADAVSAYLHGPTGLLESQQTAWDAELRARAAQEHRTLMLVRHRASSCELQEATLRGDEAAAVTWRRVVANCENEMEDSARTVARARELCESVTRGLAARAQVLAAALDDASRSGDYRSRVGWVEHHLVPALQQVSQVAGLLSTVLGCLSLLTLWCPALSGALATASLVTGILAVVCDVLVRLASPKQAKSWRSIGLSAGGTALGGTAKVFRSVAVAGRTRRGGRLVQDFAGKAAGTRLGVGHGLRTSYVPTMDMAAGAVRLSARGLVRTYPSSALPRQGIVAGSRRFLRESREELHAVAGPRRLGRLVARDWRARQTAEEVFYPRRTYRTWAFLDGGSTAATLLPMALPAVHRVRRTPSLHAATAS